MKTNDEKSGKKNDKKVIRKIIKDDMFIFVEGVIGKSVKDTM